MDCKPATIHTGPPRRAKGCYQVTQDIVIPAGTILRGDTDEVSCELGLGGAQAELHVTVELAATNSGFFRAVVA